MKINKICALLMAGAITCSAPVAVYADFNPIQIILDKGLSSVLSDPDKITDIVLEVKGMIDSESTTDEQLLSLLHQAEEKFGIDLSDSEETKLLNMIKELKNLDIDEDTLRTEISKAYNQLKDMGLDKEDAKGIFDVAVNFIKNVF